MVKFEDLEPEEVVRKYAKRARAYLRHHERIEWWAALAWKAVLLFVKIFIAPIPALTRRLAKEQRVSASALSLVYLVVTPIVLNQTILASRAPTATGSPFTESIAFKFSVAAVVSFVLGYALGRLGFFSVAALQTAVVVEVYYSYLLFATPPSLGTSLLLPSFLVPHVLVVITNPWPVSIIFYIYNLVVVLAAQSRFDGRFYTVTTSTPIPLYVIYDFGLQTVAIIISMLLYSIFQHYYDMHVINKSEKRYKSFFQENFAAIAVVDKNGEIVEVNHAFAKLFNVQSALKVDSKSHRGFGIQSYIEPNNMPAFVDLVKDSTTDTPAEADLECIRADTRTIPAHVSVKMLSGYYGFVRRERASWPWKRSRQGSLEIVPAPHGAIDPSIPAFMKRNGFKMMLVSFFDLTAQREAQSALMRAEKEKQSNEAKSKFLANMSHEIRTPVNGVMGMMQLLETTSLDKEQKMYLRSSMESANILLTLINDILDFSKIEAGLLVIEEYAFDLLETVESVAELLYPLADAKGVGLYVTVYPSVPRIVVGDAARLRQIILNLVSNAIKFTAKGQVLITCSVDATSSLSPSEIGLKFEVTDTGIGLKPEMLENMFQRFYQGEGSVTRKYGGTGLGLAISKSLAHMMGGEIGVESEYGKGSKFFFGMNFKLNMTSPPFRTRPVVTHHMHVVVISENERLLRAMTGYMDLWGYQCSGFRTLSEALSLICTHMELKRTQRMNVILCAKGYALDKVTISHLRELSAPLSIVGYLPTFVVCLQKGYKTESIPKLVSQECILCYPIKQSQLEPLIASIEAGEGSVFPYPTSPKVETPAQSPVSPPSEPKAGRVLYVDDNPISRVVISHLLQSEGGICETASSGPEVIAKLFEGISDAPPPLNLEGSTSSLPPLPKYNLLLTDIHMPEMDGFQITQIIRKKEAALYKNQYRLPIIAISADAGISLAECLSRGMDGLCNLGGGAPFTDVLLAVVRHWLQDYQKYIRKSPPAEEAIRSEPQTPKKDTQQPKILVVEDNRINQQVVCKFLEKSGYTNFDVVSDGKEALDYHSTLEYNLILMDCEMPVMDGYEATIIIREREAQDTKLPVPIIAMTAHAMATDKEKCLACGMTDYMMKPIQRVVLLDMLHKYLSSSG